MAQVGDSPAIHKGGDRDDNQEPDQVPNQVPDQVPDQVPNQVPNPAPSPFNPFLPNAPVALGPPPRPQLNWSHLSLNMQVNQMKMQKPIYLGQIPGWTFMNFQIKLRYKGFV